MAPDVRVNEPKPSSERPACPAWLRLEAKRVWKELVPQLEAMGVLGKCDRLALGRYCQVFAKWREAEQFLADSDQKNVKGYLIRLGPYELASLAIRYGDQLLRLEREFGLTPSARAGLAKPKDNVDENRGKSRFFAKGAASA